MTTTTKAINGHNNQRRSLNLTTTTINQFVRGADIVELDELLVVVIECQSELDELVAAKNQVAADEAIWFLTKFVA